MIVKYRQGSALAQSRQGRAVFKPGKESDWRRLEQALSDLLGCPVTVEANPAGEGELRVKFHSLDELDGVLARVGYEAK